MDKIITDRIYRKMFLMNDLEGETDVHHKLFHNHHNYKYMITGPKQCGKTSLLFEMAFRAAEQDFDVLFISCNPIQKLPHFHGCRQKPSTDVLDKIQIVYPKTLKECLCLLNGLTHTQTNHYQLIVVDDLDVLISTQRANMIQTCSTLISQVIDIVAFSSKLTGVATMLMCTICSDIAQYQSLIDIINLWIQNEIKFFRPISRQAANKEIFHLKCHTKNSSLAVQSDSDVVGIRATFIDGRIFFE
uniref:Uncharacterized protein n=1 Tax=Clytia hemisphaerica TaxID=252671 RepID=A0A7M5WXC7_9CNID|eukprot:TCONS_00004257-protein